MPYNPEKKITLSAVLKLELYADIPVLTQLYTRQILGPFKEIAGFSQSPDNPLSFSYLYQNNNNIPPPAKCIQSWVGEKHPMIQPTWTNFLHILRDRKVNLKETATVIECYLQGM